MSLLAAKKMLLVPGIDRDAKALMARMSPAPNTAEKAAITKFIKGLKTASLWPKLTSIFMFEATSLANALLNWKPGVNDMLAPAGMGFAPKNYIQPGYDNSGTQQVTFIQDSPKPMPASVQFSFMSLRDFYGSSPNIRKATTASFGQQIFLDDRQNIQSGVPSGDGSQLKWNSASKYFQNTLPSGITFYTASLDVPTGVVSLYGNGSLLTQLAGAAGASTAEASLQIGNIGQFSRGEGFIPAYFACAGQALTLAEHNTLRALVNQFRAEF